MARNRGARKNPSASGPYFWVRMSKTEVRAFKKSWPNSGLPDSYLGMQLNRNGDLVQTDPAQVFGSTATDQSALAALVQDARNLLIEKKKISPEDVNRGVERSRPSSPQVTPEEADRIAEKTEDAYSWDDYGESSWRACTRMLAKRGYSAYEIEEILRSKIMRWAADYASGRKGWRYGRTTCKDLERYLAMAHRNSNIEGLLDEVYGRKGNPRPPGKTPRCPRCHGQAVHHDNRTDEWVCTQNCSPQGGFHRWKSGGRAAAPCGECDCHDPTALPGLAADCGCRCHRKGPGGPAAACPRCGGWTQMGGMSQYADGPEGCRCHRKGNPRDWQKSEYLHGCTFIPYGNNMVGIVSPTGDQRSCYSDTGGCIECWTTPIVGDDGNLFCGCDMDEVEDEENLAEFIREKNPGSAESIPFSAPCACGHTMGSHIPVAHGDGDVLVCTEPGCRCREFRGGRKRNPHRRCPSCGKGPLVGTGNPHCTACGEDFCPHGRLLDSRRDPEAPCPHCHPGGAAVDPFMSTEPPYRVQKGDDGGWVVKPVPGQVVKDFPPGEAGRRAAEAWAAKKNARAGNPRLKRLGKEGVLGFYVGTPGPTGKPEFVCPDCWKPGERRDLHVLPMDRSCPTCTRCGVKVSSRQPRSRNPGAMATFTKPDDDEEPFSCPYCGSRTDWEGADPFRAVHTCQGCHEKMRFERDRECPECQHGLNQHGTQGCHHCPCMRGR